MDALQEIAEALEAAGARLRVTSRGQRILDVGESPPRARVRLRGERPRAALLRRDLLALAESYLYGDVEVEGDFLEVVKVTEAIAPDPTVWERLALAAKLFLRDRRRLQRESIAFHYDRPAEFFLPWFERWRSYSHGLYLTPDDTAEEAQERKLATAVDAMGLEPGMTVLDMGCGWGSFLEYAGLRGIRVHGITISDEQHAFCERLVREKRLPCSVEKVDFLDFRPEVSFDGAVFMGTFEHTPDYRRTAHFLAWNLKPAARVWADFCSEREGHQVGAFLARYVWPGTARYVNLPKLLDALIRAGFNVHQLVDDTLSYAYTCRDWADALDGEAKVLAENFGEKEVRVFRVFLRASQHFLATNRTQAYHLVAGLEPAEPRA